MKNYLLILIATFSFQISAQHLPKKYNDFYNDLLFSEPKVRSKKLDKAIKKEPNEPWYYWMMASFQSIVGKEAEAVKSYEKAIALDPNFSAGHGSLARQLYTGEIPQYDKALVHINKAIQLDPSEGYYFIDRGNIYLAMKDYDRAMQNANLASKNQADEIEVARLKIEILHQSGQKEALYQFVKENDLSEEGTSFGTDFMLKLASVYEEMGEKDKACQLYRYAVESFMIFDGKIPEHITEELQKCE
ncbi:MAG: tetratricopeptide repeat protein [Crocinitomicaceae bacterium]|nr:tetratricopeptide repeat protein [Crocinitomicaceae bacterium]